MTSATSHVCDCRPPALPSPILRAVVEDPARLGLHWPHSILPPWGPNSQGERRVQSQEHAASRSSRRQCGVREEVPAWNKKLLHVCMPTACLAPFVPLVLSLFTLGAGDTAQVQVTWDR